MPGEVNPDPRGGAISGIFPYAAFETLRRRASFDRNKHPIYLVSADEAKAWVANRMRISDPGAGYMHTPLTRERGWYEQLTAERLVFQKNQRRWINAQR